MVRFNRFWDKGLVQFDACTTSICTISPTYVCVDYTQCEIHISWKRLCTHKIGEIIIDCLQMLNTLNIMRSIIPCILFIFFDMIDQVRMLCKLKSWSLEDWSHIELLALMFYFNKAQNPSGSKKINETILWVLGSFCRLAMRCVYMDLAFGPKFKLKSQASYSH